MRRELRPRRFGLLLLGGAALLLSACGSNGSTMSSTDHQASLAKGESAALARELVAVPGYHYADVPKKESDAMVAVIRAREAKAGETFFDGASFHSVVADVASLNAAKTLSGGSELGFLQLYRFKRAVPQGVGEQLAVADLGQAPSLETFSAAGTTVHVFEDPSSVNSRFTLVWFRDNTIAGVDGVDRNALKAWVARYLMAASAAGR